MSQPLKRVAERGTGLRRYDVVLMNVAKPERPSSHELERPKFKRAVQIIEALLMWSLFLFPCKKAIFEKCNFI